MATPVRGPEDIVNIRMVDLRAVRANRGWFIGLGVLFLVLGIFAILLPFLASLVSAVVFGWLLMLGGIFQGVHALQNRQWGGWGWALAGAAVLLVGGVLVAAYPLRGTIALTFVLAMYFLAIGATKIVRAFQHRAMPSWGWLLFDGIVSVVLGLLIALGWPSTAIWAIGLLVGIDLFLGGTSLLLIGMSARPALGAGA
jgi:uncharacterized membrane protein HdeD (DUF308 family)